VANEIDLSALLQKFTGQYDEAVTGQQERYETGVSDLQSVIETYKPGGGSTAGLLREGMAPVEQQMISRGLSGTSRPGAVRAGMAANIEAKRAAGEAGAMTTKAGYNVPQVAPSAGTIAHLATGGFSGLLSRDIAEAGAEYDYQSRVDFGVPPIGSGGSGGGISGGGISGGGGSSVDSGYENDLYDQLGGDDTGGTGGGEGGAELDPGMVMSGGNLIPAGSDEGLYSSDQIAWAKARGIPLSSLQPRTQAGNVI